jgi:hypothetical protein
MTSDSAKGAHGNRVAWESWRREIFGASSPEGLVLLKRRQLRSRSSKISSAVSAERKTLGVSLSHEQSP